MKRKIVLFAAILALLVTMMPVISYAAESYMWPVPATKTLSRGYSSSHDGLDIAAGKGSTVVATKSGTVYYVYTGCKNNNAASSSGVSCTSAGCSPNTGNFYTYGSKKICNWGYGNGLVIKHSDGSGFSSYAHMSTVSVTKGQTVSQGQTLGTVGSTGNSTGAHLHFALFSSASMSGTYVKPGTVMNNNKDKIAYVDSPGSGSSGTTTTVTPAPSAPNVSFSLPTDANYTSKQYVGNTNAVICNKITKPSGVNVTAMGVILMDSAGNQIKKYQETVKNVTDNQTYYHSWYDINSEVGVTLTPGTTYKYKFFGVFNGYTVNGGVYSFTTTGTAPHSHSYVNGPYYDAAHPHNGYYTCSCGAKDYVPGMTGMDPSCTTCYPPVQQHVHSYDQGPYYDTAHPHNGYYKCSCGEKKYQSGLTRTDSDCTTCYPPVEEHVHFYIYGPENDTSHPHYVYYECSCGERQYDYSKTGSLSSCTECSRAGSRGGNIRMVIGSPVIWIDDSVQSIDQQGTAPVIRNSRTLLPVRAVVEAMGGSVGWDGSSQIVSMSKDGMTLYMMIGSKVVWDNTGASAVLDSAPQIINSRTMLPIRFVAEYFGGSVGWDGSTNTVSITY